MNDNLKCNSFLSQKCIWLPGRTATKEMLAQRRKPPHSVYWSHWVNSFHQIISMETSIAQIHGIGHWRSHVWNSAAADAIGLCFDLGCLVNVGSLLCSLAQRVGRGLFVMLFKTEPGYGHLKRILQSH